MTTGIPTADSQPEYAGNENPSDHPPLSPRRIERGGSGGVGRLWRIGRVILLALVVVAVFCWFRLRPVQVRAHTVETGDIVEAVMGTGTLEARVKAVISPKISGRVATVFADQGNQVTAGQPLVQLDDEELRQQVEIAMASVEVAQAAPDRLTADKERAVAVFAQAEFDYNRTKGLYESDIAANIEIEKATEALHIARAELARADAAIVECQESLNA